MLIDWLFLKSEIRSISDVEVITVSAVAPTLPETVSVDVNHSLTGVISEERVIVWDDIVPQNYGNDGLEKIIKHMEGFKLLIEQQEKNNLILTETYNKLKADADSLILSTKWK